MVITKGDGNVGEFAKSQATAINRNHVFRLIIIGAALWTTIGVLAGLYTQNRTLLNSIHPHIHVKAG